MKELEIIQHRTLVMQMAMQIAANQEDVRIENIQQIFKFLIEEIEG